MFSDLLNEGGLSLDRLRSFCLVAQAGGVTRAARNDAGKQSMFSRQIKDLEEFFGAELIRRRGRGVVLTDAGQRLQRIARECFASLADFKDACKGQPVEVVIGAGESIIQWLIMPHLDTLRTLLTNVRLKFLNLTTAEAVRRLADGVLDFAVVRQDAIASPLESKLLGTMRYSLFVPSTMKIFTPRDGAKVLDSLPLATLEGEGAFRNELAAAARHAGLTLNVQVQCSSFPLAARAVSHGNVAAILPSIAAAEMRGLAIAELPLELLKLPERKMGLAWNPRLLRIRPVLRQVAATLARTCRL